MELILESPSILKKSMDIISEIVLEGTLVVKKDYIELVALNSNNVVMVIFRLLSTNFEKYDVENEEQHITINFEHFNDILRRCNDREKLKITLTENSLKIITLGNNPKEFELSLIDFVDENLQKIPDLKFPVKIITKATNLSEAINDLSFIEEGVDFIVENKKFIIEGKTPTRKGKIEFKEDIDIITEDENQTYKSKYTINYLKKFIKGDKIVNNVELSFNNDYPLKVEYKIIDKLLLGFILAPRGED